MKSKTLSSSSNGGDGGGNHWHAALAAHKYGLVEKYCKTYKKAYWKMQKEKRRQQEGRLQQLQGKLNQQEQQEEAASTVHGDTKEQPTREQPKDHHHHIPAPSQEEKEASNKKSSRGKRISSLLWGRRGSRTDSNNNRKDPLADLPLPPLLETNHYGQTPLHVACQDANFPTDLLLTMISLEPQALQIRDVVDDWIPLHGAIQNLPPNIAVCQALLGKGGGAIPFILRCKTKRQGLTPLGVAIQGAIGQSSSIDDQSSDYSYSWTFPPRTPEEGTWQDCQYQIWQWTEHLLHYGWIRCNKYLLPTEGAWAVQRICPAGAPPAVMRSLLQALPVQASFDLLQSCLETIVQRQYPLIVLQTCLEKILIIERQQQQRSALVQVALETCLAMHYRQGCVPQGHDTESYGQQLMDWKKEQKEDDLLDMEESMLSEEEDVSPHGGKEEKGDGNKSPSLAYPTMDTKAMAKDGLLSNACLAWWEKLCLLIFATGYPRPIAAMRPLHVVHAALAIPTTPPSLIQLLLVLFPHARTVVCPIFHALPIHLLCVQWKYAMLLSTTTATDHRQTEEIIQRVVDQIMLVDDHNNQHALQGRRNLLHLALAAGQGWNFCQTLYKRKRRMIQVRDPLTGLFPFQMAAMKWSSKNTDILLRSRMTPQEWMGLSKEERKECLAQVEEIQAVRQVETIFELLRAYPSAIEFSNQKHNKASKMGVGLLSAHYLQFCYSQVPLEMNWRPKEENLRLLRYVIRKKSLPPQLFEWYEQLKFFVWYKFPGDKDSVPKTDEFLLHAALYNPNTPPIIIEVILALNPTSAMIRLPKTDTYPLHICAGTTAYTRQPFEIRTLSSLELVLRAYEPAVKFASHKRLPLHIAVARGKNWDEIRSLVAAYPKSVFSPDPITGLVPFAQMAASSWKTPELNVWVQKQTQRYEPTSLPMIQKIEFLQQLRRRQVIVVATTVFELMKAGPEAYQSCLLPSTAKLVSEFARASRSKNLSKSASTETRSSSPTALDLLGSVASRLTSAKAVPADDDSSVDSVTYGEELNNFVEKMNSRQSDKSDHSRSSQL